MLIIEQLLLIDSVLFLRISYLDNWVVTETVSFLYLINIAVTALLFDFFFVLRPVSQIQITAITLYFTTHSTFTKNVAAEKGRVNCLPILFYFILFYFVQRIFYA